MTLLTLSIQVDDQTLVRRVYQQLEAVLQKQPVTTPYISLSVTNGDEETA